MDYREIVSVTGIGALFQLLPTKSDGAIVRNLADKSTKFIPARLHNVTPLESIEVYTTGENVRLHEVFEKMTANSSVSMPDGKADNTAIKGYFQQVFPDLDEHRVYISDMKKMLKWYLILKENELLNFDSEKGEAISEEASEVTADPATPSEEKPAKKARAKKSADEGAAPDAEEKPKKTVRKKKTADTEAETGEEVPKKTAKKKQTDK